MARNEARFRANYSDVKGGESPMVQQQNYSLAALAKRDAQEDPFASKTPLPQLAAAPPPEEKTPTPTRAMMEHAMESFEAQLREALV